MLLRLGSQCVVVESWIVAWDQGALLELPEEEKDP
jgi:hypothetical protein